MKPKTMILMVVAVTCGLGASYMTSRLLAERGTPVDETEKVTVLVAKKNLDMGMLVKNPQDLFEEKQFTRGDEPKSGLTSFDAIKDRSLKRPLRAGDWISEDDLLERGKIGMMGQLPAGHRAVGIRVNPESIAGGFASLPLSRVDIFATLRRGDDKTSKAVLLMEDVLVLAADTNQFRDPENRAQVATVVTVALKPSDITKVRLAESFGPLTLALRGLGERRVDENIQTTFQDIIMNTANKKDQIVEGPPDPIGPPVTITNPPVTDPKTVPIPQPKEVARVVHRTQRVSIFNGSQQEFWEYTFDENDRVIDCRQVNPGTSGGDRPARPDPNNN